MAIPAGIVGVRRKLVEAGGQPLGYGSIADQEIVYRDSYLLKGISVADLANLLGLGGVFLNLYNIDTGQWYRVNVKGPAGFEYFELVPGVAVGVRPTFYNTTTSLWHPLTVRGALGVEQIELGDGIASPGPQMFNSDTGMWHNISIVGAAGFEQIEIGAGVP